MKKISVLFFIFILLLGMSGMVAVYADGEDSPVYITQNSDFTKYTTIGNGSAGNPYVLSGNWVTYSTASVYIQNTDAYAIINGASISGAGYYGIYLENVENLNVTNTNINDKMAGIFISSCYRVLFDTVTINTLVNSDYGMKIDQSDVIGVWNCDFASMSNGLILVNNYRLSILDNTFVNSGISFYMTDQISSNSIMMTGNIINGKPIGYLYGAHDRIYDVSAFGQGILVNCVNVTVYNANIVGTTIGIQLLFSQNCVVDSATVSDNYIGILIYESSYCKVTNSIIDSNVNGIVGYFAIGTIITANNVTNNSHIGLWAYYGCSSSLIALNNFIGNTLNARDDGGIEDSKLIWAGVKFTNSVSGWRLNNVSVTLEQYGRSYTGYSNELGIFKVPLPNLGPYNITIEKFRYQTKNILNYADVQEGINIYEMSLEKDDLGPGTGFVQVRFMDGINPVEGATVNVYSYLDGAYYFHSQYTSITGGVYAGWVNITGLYYDNYTIVITHPDYERKTIQQVVISNGLVGTYNNIQLSAYPIDAYIYGNIYDMSNDLPLENVNITIYNDERIAKTIFTNVDGFFNMTAILFGVYQVEVNLNNYQTYYDTITVDIGGNQTFNPVTLYLMPNDYVPEVPTGAVVNNWDNQVFGNYWDDFGGIVVLAEESTAYSIPGDNIDNPVDEHPLSSPYNWKNPTITTITKPIISPIVDNEIDSLLVFATILAVISIIVILSIAYKFEKR